MKKKTIAITLVVLLIMVSAASAGIFDRFRLKNPAPKANEELNARGDLELPVIPGIPINFDETGAETGRMPMSDDAENQFINGVYSMGAKTPGIWGESQSADIGNQGVYGHSKYGWGVAASTERGDAAIWAANAVAKTTAMLAAKTSAVYGLTTAPLLFAGEFLGGKGVYSEKGYATKDEINNKVVQGITANCKAGAFKVVNGLIVDCAR